jgi:non-specific serine/threonine protein kinase
MPAAVQNNTGAVLDGTAWVAGGLAPGTRATRRTQGYDPVVNGWKTGPKLPRPLHHEMAVTYKDELVVIGGWIPEGSDPSAITSDRVYALRGSKWVQLPALNKPRAAGAAAVVGDKIVVVGGQADGKLVPTTEVFDGKQWQTKAPMPTPREHLAAASDGKYLYAVGGRNLTPDKNSAALERYDPETDTWERLPDMPTPRGGLGAAIVGGHLVAAGGETPTDVLGKVESYNPTAKRWTRAPSLRDPRHGVVVLAIGRSLYVLGGGRRPGHDSATDTGQVLRLTGG